jgi:hypothetical protein
MVLPVSEAKPAKLMRAELASHMIATLVLFNWFFTLRALFRVGHDPGNVLAFIRIFSLPLNSCFATARTVWFLTALETERVSTLTLNITDTIILVLDTIVAPWVWAPSHALIIIRVWFTEPFIISAQIVSFQIFQKHWVRNCHVTHVLGTSCLHALLETVIHCLNKPIIPVFSAELMPTA